MSQSRRLADAIRTGGESFFEQRRHTACSSSPILINPYRELYLGGTTMCNGLVRLSWKNLQGWCPAAELRVRMRTVARLP